MRPAHSDAVDETEHHRWSLPRLCEDIHEENVPLSWTVSRLGGRCSRNSQHHIELNCFIQPGTSSEMANKTFLYEKSDLLFKNGFVCYEIAFSTFMLHLGNCFCLYILSDLLLNGSMTVMYLNILLSLWFSYVHVLLQYGSFFVIYMLNILLKVMNLHSTAFNSCQTYSTFVTSSFHSADLFSVW